MEKLSWLNIYSCRSQDRVWHKIFFYSGVLGKWGKEGDKTHALLDYAGDWLTRRNISQMTLLGLGLTKFSMRPKRMPAHSLN